MATDFLHGIETIELSNGARPIQVAKSSVIGYVGTAKRCALRACSRVATMSKVSGGRRPI